MLDILCMVTASYLLLEVQIMRAQIILCAFYVNIQHACSVEVVILCFKMGVNCCFKLLKGKCF